jgi:hypothetical protein
MNIVHISETPVAGSPGNIVAALNRTVTLHARHVVFNSAAYGARRFACDIDWQSQPAQALEAIEHADVIHLHQYFSLENTFGADFKRLLDGKKLIRQFHSAPDLWTAKRPELLDEILHEPIPHLVIAQGPERFYPHARVVPNLVPLHDTRYLPGPESDGLPLVVFSPSGKTSAWRKRWETKGVPQTLRLLRKFERAGLCRVQLIIDMPHDACLRIKQSAAVAVDECVTGNYHLSGLEALSQGKPTLGYLDERVQSQLRHLTGAIDLPWVNVRLEEAAAPLRDLLQDPALRAEVGRASRAWMERFYDEQTLVEVYQQAYRDLLEAPERFSAPRLRNLAERWRALDLPDQTWTARKQASSVWRRIAKYVGR